MKKIQVLHLIILLTILSCGTKSETKVTYANPEEIGKAVFATINMSNKISLDAFKKIIISYSDIKELVKDKKAPIGEFLRNDFNSITLENYEKVISKDFRDIKSAGEKFNIDWRKITFVKHTSRIQEIDEGRLQLGETYFKNRDNKIYFVKSAAIYNGKNYQIIKIAEIELKRDSIKRRS